MDRPEDTSLMKSQLLFGEFVKQLARPKFGWVKIQTTSDKCEGYVRINQIKRISESAFAELDEDKSVALETCDAVFSDDHNQSVLIGSSLSKYDGISFKMADESLRYTGQAIKPDITKLTKEVFFKLARKFMYSPNLRGGRSVFGLDGAAFVQLVFKMVGIHLYRDARSQLLIGETVNFINEARWGDIAYFENEDGYVTHSGIILDENEIIHVGEYVRIDLIDHKGIYNRQIKKYTHELRIIKRVMKLPDLESTTI